MNRQWIPADPMYKCNRCGREVFVRGGYLPIHRHKGKRVQCDASADPIRNHKKVGP